MIPQEGLNNPEIQKPTYENILVSVANHEAKALTFAYMASKEKSHYFTAEDLDRGLVNIQGQEPAWVPGKGVPSKYCDHSFEPIGGVLKSRVENSRGRLVTAYTVTDLGHKEALAMSGLVLDWSLKYPELSVQTILGATQSKTGNRAPAHRLAVLESVLTAVDEGVSYDDIEKEHSDIPGIRTVIESLKDKSFAKLVDISTNRVKYDPILSIIDPEYRGKRPYEGLRPERKAIYETMHEISTIKKLGKVSLGDFIDQASQNHSDLDPKEIRATLMQAISPGRAGLPGLKIEEADRGALGARKSSLISVKPEFREPIADLLNQLEMYRYGENHDNYRRRAIEIVKNEDSCSQLMDKAFRNSNKAKVAQSSVSVDAIIVQMLESSTEPLSVADITHQLDSKYDLPVSVNSVRNHITKLREEKKIDSFELTEIKQGRAQKLTHFILNK